MTTRPTGERVASLETGLNEMLRRMQNFEAGQDRMFGELAEIKAAQRERKASARLVAHVFELGKLVIASIIGAGAMHYLGEPK
jgi:hypothetical protein